MPSAESPTLGIRFDLPPDVALAAFRAKGLRVTQDYLEMTAEEHAAAFTVAKMLDLDLLAEIRAAVDQALADGLTVREFQDRLLPQLEAAGWTGPGLGSPARLETIFRTNLQTAYAAGHWEEIARNAADAPYLMYDAIDDDRVDELCAADDRTVLPVGDPFWSQHAPPRHYNCRCSVIQLDAEDLQRLGLTVAREAPPRAAEHTAPGWGGNPGERMLQRLAEVARQKIDALPPDLRAGAVQFFALHAQSGTTPQIRAVSHAVVAPPAPPSVRPVPPTPARAPVITAPPITPPAAAPPPVPNAAPTPRPAAHPARSVGANVHVQGTAADVIDRRVPELQVTERMRLRGGKKGINQTFKVPYTAPNGRRVAVALKPLSGEEPWMVAKTGGAAADREVGAYEVSHALGLDIVPPTWAQDAHLGARSIEGSAQYWLPGATLGEAWTDVAGAVRTPERARRWLNMSLLDKILANGDRHGGNFVIERRTQRAWAIDNGFTLYSRKAWPQAGGEEEYLRAVTPDGTVRDWLAGLATLDETAVRDALVRAGVEPPAAIEHAVWRTRAIRETAADWTAQNGQRLDAELAHWPTDVALRHFYREAFLRYDRATP